MQAHTEYRKDNEVQKSQASVALLSSAQFTVNGTNQFGMTSHIDYM